MAEELAQIDAQKTESAEDAIASFLFGKDEPQEEPDEPEAVEAADEEPEEQEEEQDKQKASEEESDEPETVEIEIEGEVLEVPAKYKDYFMRQKDYTEKTQALSSDRKTVDVLRGELEQQRALFEFSESVNPDVLKVQSLVAQEDQLKKYLKDNVDSLSHTDIEKIRIGIEDSRSERDQIINSIREREQKFQQAQQQAREELLKKGTEALKSRIPGWDEKAAKQVREFALSSGFGEEEIQSVIDPRQVEVLWKASQYDALKAGAAPAIKKVQKAPPIKAKARNPMPDDVKQKLNLNKQLKSNKLTASEKANLIGRDIASRLMG